MRILHSDETETGPRLRKTLVDKGGITPTIVRADIGGVMIRGAGTAPQIDLWTYRNPAGAQRWFIEVMSWIPPDAQVWRSWTLDAEPTDDQVRDIVARNPETEA